MKKSFKCNTLPPFVNSFVTESTKTKSMCIHIQKVFKDISLFNSLEIDSENEGRLRYILEIKKGT